MKKMSIFRYSRVFLSTILVSLVLGPVGNVGADTQQQLELKLVDLEHERDGILAEESLLASRKNESLRLYETARIRAEELVHEAESLRTALAQRKREIEDVAKQIEALIKKHSEVTSRRELLEDSMTNTSFYLTTAYRTSAEAWAADKSYTATYRALDRRAPELREKHNDVQGEYLLNASKIENLQREKESTLKEMREGEFCTGCGKTRTQILKEGSEFPHPGQQIRNATQEELDKAEKSFDSKIAEFERKQPYLSRETDRLASELDKVLRERQEAFRNANTAHNAALQLEAVEKGRQETLREIDELKSLEKKLEAEERQKREQQKTAQRDADNLERNIQRVEADYYTQINAANRAATNLQNVTAEEQVVKRRKLRAENDIKQIRRELGRL